MGIRRNSISDLILATLFSARSTYTFNKILKSEYNSRINEGSLSTTLARLHRNNYVERSTDGWRITDEGIVESKRLSSLYIVSPFNHDSEHNTLVSFDISENNRKTRSWVRNQLKIFNYKMLQQSLWVGPGPFDRYPKIKTLFTPRLVV